MVEVFAPELQAVLVADAVGFTVEMDRDPNVCIHEMLDARERMAALVKRNGGRTVDTPGDFILAVFSSVESALSTGRTFTSHADPAAANRLAFRVAIDVGEVYPVDGKLLGPAINVAARLQELAGRNGIVVSEGAYQALSRREKFRFSFLDEFSLKNISRPIRAYRLSEGKDAGAETSLRSLQSPVPVVFVRPFHIIGTSESSRLFAEGLNEELLTVLGAIRGVIAVKTSESASLGSPGYEVSGQIRGLEDLRLTARLRSLHDGELLWTGRFNCADMDDFGREESISRRIVEAIQLTLSDGEWARIWSGSTTTMETWEHFQQGRVLEAAATRHSLRRAKEHYRLAIASDPGFVPARIALGFCLVDEIRLGLSVDALLAKAEVVELLDEILQAAPSDPYGHGLLAFSKCLERKHSEACEIMHRVVTDCPESPELLSYYAVLLEYQGQLDDAIRMYERALRLTRHPPAWIRTNLAMARMVNGDPAASSMLELDVRSNPRNVRAHVGLVAVEVQNGRIDTAHYWAGRLRSLEPDFEAERWRDTVCFSDLSTHRRIAELLRRAGL